MAYVGYCLARRNVCGRDYVKDTQLVANIAQEYLVLVLGVRPLMEPNIEARHNSKAFAEQPQLRCCDNRLGQESAHE